MTADSYRGRTANGRGLFDSSDEPKGPILGRSGERSFAIIKTLGR